MPSKISKLKKTLANYDEFGGDQAEVSAMTKLLRFASVSNPFTAELVTETEVFGLAGGIGSGYSFCPSIPRHGTGGGVTYVARHNVLSYDGAYQQTLFKRLSQKLAVAQSGGLKKAQSQVVEHLEAGRPVMVSSGRTFDYFGGPEAYAPDPCCGHAVVVYDLDSDTSQAKLADLASESITTSLSSLAEARKTICTHKNRSFSLVESKSLTKTQWKNAVKQSLKACADGLLRCRVKTFSIHGLEKGIKAMPNVKAKSGWGQQFPGGKLIWALHSGYVSIENSEASTGLSRKKFATYLNHAAEVLKSKTLGTIAEQYSDLAQNWTNYANAMLPDSEKRCKDLKKVEKSISQLLRDKFDAKKYAKLVKKRRDLLENCTNKPILTDNDRLEHLKSLATTLKSLQDQEFAAANQLDELSRNW